MTITTIPIEQLTNTIRSVVDNIDNVSLDADLKSTREIVAPIRDLGITPNLHVGCGEDMKGDSDLAKRFVLEWYAGSILDIVDSQAWFAMNSLINCKDKFAPEINYEQNTLSIEV